MRRRRRKRSGCRAESANVCLLVCLLRCLARWMGVVITREQGARLSVFDNVNDGRGCVGVLGLWKKEDRSKTRKVLN
jgi:hypothetical protein